MIPFLAGLGVSDTDLARSPTPWAFPKAFSQNCKHVWDEVVGNLDSSEDKDLNWGLAVRSFVETCVDRDLYPFSNQKQATNDMILHRLVDARRAVVKFLNNSRIQDIADVRATRRTVNMITNGFVLRVFGRATVKDPTFKEWLLRKPYPGFHIKHDGMYRKVIGAGITMVVYNEGANGTHRWHMGYEIVVNAVPDMPIHLPSNAELESFILKVLWAPVMRAQRPFKYKMRPL